MYKDIREKKEAEKGKRNYNPTKQSLHYPNQPTVNKHTKYFQMHVYHRITNYTRTQNKGSCLSYEHCPETQDLWHSSQDH